MKFKPRYLNIFKDFNLWIEYILKKSLHKNKPYYINKTMEKFKDAHHPDEATMHDFKEKLEIESDRVYAFVDRGIIRSQIQRAGIAFIVTLTVGEAAVAVAGAATGTALTVVPFLIPIPIALAAWGVTIATIPILYNQRVKGSMDATYVLFEKSYEAALLHELEKSKTNQLDNTAPLTDHPINANDLIKIQKTLDDIKHSLDALSKDPINTDTAEKTLVSNQTVLSRNQIINKAQADIAGISFWNKPNNDIAPGNIPSIQENTNTMRSTMN